jgi:cyclase
MLSFDYRMRAYMIYTLPVYRSLPGWCSLAAALVCAGAGKAQPIDVVQIRPNFFVLAGGGGNIAVQAGPDGLVLVNSGNGTAAAPVLAAIQKISDQPIRYILNTGADSDQVGGNAKLSKAGRNIYAAGTEPLGGELARDMTNGYAASIMAPEAVLQRMSAPTGKTAPYPSDAWPTESFAEKRRYIYLNHEGIEMFRQPAAHSNADSIVFFRASDVVAAGDILDARHFPVIDLENGGSIQGEIDALNQVIALAVRPVPFPFEGGGTYIIPGHGRVYDLDDVVAYRDMVVTIRDIVRDMIERGMPLEQILAASPARPYQRQYGANTREFLEAVYRGLTKKTKP